MRAVIDTSSLLALVRYYLTFDKKDSLKMFIKRKIDTGEIIVVDKVFDESKYISKGIISRELEFLKNKIAKTTEIFPNTKFFNQLENQLCYGVKKKLLSPTQFESEKQNFLDSADAKEILFCIKDNDSLNIDAPILVTEETRSENDSKLFKKLPEICSILEIQCCNLPTFLKNHLEVRLSEHLV